jgi:hypothetical protein
MKSKNFEVSLEILDAIELQETVGGAWYSFITDCLGSCFKPTQQITPMQTYRLPSGTATLRAGTLPQAFAVT